MHEVEIENKLADVLKTSLNTGTPASSRSSVKSYCSGAEYEYYDTATRNGTFYGMQLVFVRSF